MDNATAWKILESITDLPTLPSVYFKVNQLLQDKQAGIENVAHVIEMDPGMSASILRLVNSAFYGLPAKSQSISQAVMILGFNAVKNAVVSVAVLDALSVKEKLPNFSMTDFWRHSAAVAVIGRHLAKISRLVPPEDAFMAGLLHDMGKIILIRYFNEDFRKIWQVMQETHCSFYEAEQEVATMDHVQIGAYLARKWQLPEPIIAAIAGHHYCLSSEKSSGLVECVMIANALANNNYQISPADYVFETHIEKALGPLLADTQSWLPQALDELETAYEFFVPSKK